MNSKRDHKFVAKHGPDAQPDPEIAAALKTRGKGGELACAVAFAIAEELGKPPGLVGEAADLLGLRLVKCQLGLFGYAPVKKIVKPKRPEDPALAAAIREAAAEGRLSCRTAWQIAARFGLRKMAVSSACEALGQKIKPCQLGAF
ncbi:MAG: hypothetical protein PVG78_03405 [Desulfobacterales bacterium]|jgi:hypothetical protein